MKSQKDLTFEDKVLIYLSRIEVAISGVGGIGHTIERLYNDWKFPVMTSAEQMAPKWEKQEEKERAERQLKTIQMQNWILIVTILINATVGIFAALIQSGLIKIK